jgi:hypothetical protein
MEEFVRLEVGGTTATGPQQDARTGELRGLVGTIGPLQPRRPVSGELAGGALLVDTDPVPPAALVVPAQPVELLERTFDVFDVDAEGVARRLVAAALPLCTDRPGHHVVMRAQLDGPPATRRWLAGFGASAQLVQALRRHTEAAGAPLWWERAELRPRPATDGPTHPRDAGGAAFGSVLDALRHGGPRQPTNGAGAISSSTEDPTDGDDGARRPPTRGEVAAWLGPETAAAAQAFAALGGVDPLEVGPGAVDAARSLLLDLLDHEHAEPAANR